MAIVGAIIFAVMAMLLHLATAGGVFSNRYLVPGAAALVLVWGRASFPTLRIQRRHLVAVLLFGLALSLLYLVPALRGGSSVRAGDPPWHLGWTEQLLSGDALPTGPAPEVVARNAYPWGFHAVVATLVRLVPGSNALVALDAIFLLIMVGIPAMAAAIARRIDPRAGWGAALSVSVIGGFGWIAARMPEFSLSPRAGRFGADLVVASPNSAYELFPPGLPRELGLVLVGAAAFLIVWAHRGRPRQWMLAGATVGLVGLVSVPMLVSALAWLVVGAALEPAGARARALVAGVGPALIVFSLWAAPVIVNFMTEGGFVNITPRLGKEWPLPIALGSWGLLLIGTVLGIRVAWLRWRPQASSVLSMAAATAVILGLALARGVFDWRLGGNATLLHQGRVWPPAHLLAAVFSGLALTHLAGKIPSRPRLVLGAGVFLAVASASLVLASIELGDVAASARGGFAYGEQEISGSDSFVQRAAAVLPADAVVEVRGPDELAFLLWQFSGVRLASYDDPRLADNDLRIRYRDLAAQWDETVAAGGYRATHKVEPIAANSTVVSGLATGRFEGVDYVLYASDE